MFFANFDFLNSPPQLYYLQKRTNKTIIGGILFLLYLIIIIIIFAYYIVNNYLNDRYDISYSLHKAFSDNPNNNDLKGIDPKFNFSINIYKINKDFDYVEIYDKFLVYDNYFNLIENNTFYSKNPDDIQIYIYSNCLYNCSLVSDEEDISYVVKFTYQGYKIEHQNKNIPLDAKNGNYTFVKELYFSLDKSTLFGIDWEIIKYKEEKGLLGLFDDWINKKNEYVAFDISSINKITTEKIIKLNLLETVDLRLLSTINFGERNIQYVEYKRTKKSLLDVLANVGSLFSSFLAIFNYIFSLYSRNLNNYQIIQIKKIEILISNQLIQVNRYLLNPTIKIK